MPKIRNFAFMMYQDSFNPGFHNVLARTEEKIFYIYHDKDTLEHKTLKKPHYHVLVMFENSRSIATAERIAKECGCANNKIEIIRKAYVYARYLCHLDQPDKHLYKTDEVTSLNGANYEEFISSKANKKNNKIKIIKEISNFIRKNSIDFYSDFVDYCCMYNDEWLEFLTTYSGKWIKEYIKSRTFAESSCKNNSNKTRFDFTKAK